MEQMWIVCELEESTNIRLSIFERFSVVAVPESWAMLREDGTLVCFWPGVDAELKIRSLKKPKKGEKCAYYKCRILMDGGNLYFFYPTLLRAEIIFQTRQVVLRFPIRNSIKMRKTHFLF